MPELLIMRHAKSDWHAGLADIDRPLNERGRADAQRIGAELARRGIMPGVVLVSPAARAQETASGVVSALATAPPIETLDPLYLAEASTLLETLAASLDRHPLLIAHNPGLDELLGWLCGSHLPRTANGKLMTTANVAIVESADRDSLYRPGACRLCDLVRPKAL